MTQQRLSLSSMIAAAAAVAALGLPGMASAAYEHPANNETGVIVHPEHFKSEKTRAQVIAETKAAMQQGRLSYGESNYPIGTPTLVHGNKERGEACVGIGLLLLDQRGNAGQ